VSRATELFEAIDRMDADGWVSHLASDVVMRFANEDPVYGGDACRAQARILFASVTGLSHHILAFWEHGDTTIVETSVTVTLDDARRIPLPMVTIYRTDRVGLIADYRVYLDPSPLRR
jgi:ketosteroid isomerase-like protein